ncbi:E3 [Equine adenovirus 2]|uniref:E3 n=1 Tax=Equine adenovirus B serotype 2 TaxID=67603 RepID=A0A0K1DBT2_ADEE2|nr:E3 [Equine adenovirus 2]AKT26015.1 E3 [Equine adenovirus 2]
MNNFHSFRARQQELLLRLSHEHKTTCERGRCFAKLGLVPTFFFNPALGEELVPDSYQEGHGLILHVPVYQRQKVKDDLPQTVIISALRREGQIKLTCKCHFPVVHDWLLNLLCHEFNKSI